MKHILMIKKLLGHPLKYLCKTSSSKVNDDPLYPYKYQGSGKRWLNHIKSHGRCVITCVIGEYDTIEELRAAGIYYSSLYNIVESDEWANLTEERGDGGKIGNGQLGRRWKMSAEARANVAAAQQKRNLEKTELDKHKQYSKITGSCNYQFKGFIQTPWGRFESVSDAITEAKRLRKSGRLDVITDDSCLRHRVNNPDSLFNTPRIAFNGWRNKTAAEVGFGIIKEIDDEDSL